MSDIDELKAELAQLRDRVGMLEDHNAIRRLHYAYGYYTDYNRAEDLANLFADDAEIIFLSGIYRGKEGARRLYGDWFQQFFTQGQVGPVYGFLLDHFQMQDIITVAPDRQTAKGRFRAVLFGGNHESREYAPPGLPNQFYEAGMYENDYVREDGVWKIKRLDYVVQWQADYEKGWYGTVAHLQPLTTCFPEDPLGPDELIENHRQTWPYRQNLEMHYAHPVLGKAVGGL
ncbi:nuclear transport factor 2 family protein [Novosphingobium sp. FSY-8]|uniref:Nuclear transport factor 2 family protein n=1 Tax=Novosphingobium ovatum TaxID=1908523 RepID=A0ABW9XFW3_9SPHN|nr:nuclear transport factor 2 family protein [Novosphingobium ovatum]NBC37437.1 nuclear transport factor 2 family protein [Novosphingobium ovatum]